MCRRAAIALACVAFMAGFAGNSYAQPMTRCASCHFANMALVPAPEHLGDWQRSAHAKNGVGCDRCHGGDPWTYEPSSAHRGVLNPASPSSPVNNENLVRTCSACHAQITTAFATSLHQSLAGVESSRAPTCTACHGSMSAHVPSPAALELRCGFCHPPGSARRDYASVMRTSIEALNTERLRADAIASDVERVGDRGRRAELAAALTEAHASLAEAVSAAHTFDVPRLNNRILDARRRLDEVGARIK